MSENKTPNVAVDSTPAKPNLLNKIVERLNPQHRDNIIGPDGKVETYFITHVTNGQQTTEPCTAQVWRWAEHSKPWLDHKAEWILNVDRNNKNLVVGVTRKPKVDKGPLSARLDMSASNLMLQKLGSTFEPLNLPITFQSPVLEHAIQTMNKVGDARVGEIIGDTFVVKQVITTEDQPTIFALGHMQ